MLEQEDAVACGQLLDELGHLEQPTELVSDPDGGRADQDLLGRANGK